MYLGWESGVEYDGMRVGIYMVGYLHCLDLSVCDPPSANLGSLNMTHSEYCDNQNELIIQL